MNFKKIIGFLHLWLGLLSGAVVFVIAITGCLYAFQQELQDLTQPYRFVKKESKQFLPPSHMRTIADNQLPGKNIHAVLYKTNSEAAEAIYYSEEEDYYYKVYLNPYSGAVQQVSDMKSGFFPFILEGHFYLWLPHEVGQPVVAVATLVFVVLLLSGLYLWWKRKKGSPGQRLSIKLNARWRRRNYDLHNVFGFYVMAFAFILAVTGLVWGFEWFSRTYYYVASGGKQQTPYYEPKSDTINTMNLFRTPVDQIWNQLLKELPIDGALEIHFPENRSASVAANLNPDPNTYWKTDYRYFDQYTMKELPVAHTWGRAQSASTADNLMRMNYDLHTGAIAGLPGKVLAFFASLVVASLPVTGFLIWWGRKNKEKRKMGKQLLSSRPVKTA